MTEERKEKTHETEVVLHEQEEGLDRVRISSEVIAVIAGTAAGEVKGLAGMSGSIVGGIAEKLGRKDFSRGIKVTLEDKKVYLELYIIVEYGYRIQDITRDLMNTVRSAVEDATGLQVESVNIYVQGIHLSEKEGSENESD